MHINEGFETDREFLDGNDPLFEASQSRREVAPVLSVCDQLLPIIKY
jgi:hypothetical protein